MLEELGRVESPDLDEEPFQAWTHEENLASRF